jgi:hypothetical protein
VWVRNLFSYIKGVDCLLLFNIFRHADSSCVPNENSVDSAVNNPTAIAREAINLVIPYIKSNNSFFPHWFSNFLILVHYIKEKSQHLRRCKKSKYDHNYSVFSYHRKLVETTTKRDRLHWLKTVDDNLKSKPKDFWRRVFKFKKNYHVVTQLKIGENKDDTASLYCWSFCGSFFLDF